MGVYQPGEGRLVFAVDHVFSFSSLFPYACYLIFLYADVLLFSVEEHVMYKYSQFRFSIIFNIKPSRISLFLPAFSIMSLK